MAELVRDAGPVAMVGDCINDAPALAVADVGITMGASGSTVALETADVALMADELHKLPAAIRLARRAAIRPLPEQVDPELGQRAGGKRPAQRATADTPTGRTTQHTGLLGRPFGHQ